MKARKSDHNRAKYAVLKCLSHAERYLTAREVSEVSGLTPDATWSALRRLVRGKYIHRHRETRKRRRNKWVYKCLKPKGWRVLTKFEVRLNINPKASLNLNFHHWRDTSLSRTQYEEEFGPGGVRE